MPLPLSASEIYLSHSETTSDNTQEHTSDLLSSLRENECTSLACDVDGDERLEWRARELCYSKGKELLKCFEFDHVILQALFAWFPCPLAPAASSSTTSASNSKDDNLFGPFFEKAQHPWAAEHSAVPSPHYAYATSSSQASDKTISVFFRDSILVYYISSGHTRIVPMPFRLQRAWAGATGLMVEKRADPSFAPRSIFASMPHPAASPAIYTLSAPYDEFRPLSLSSSHKPLDLNHLPAFRPFLDPTKRILLLHKSSTKLSLLFIYDMNKNTVSISLLAQFTDEDMQHAVLKQQQTHKPPVNGNGNDNADPRPFHLSPDLTSLDIFPALVPTTQRKTSGSKPQRNLMDLVPGPNLERETSMMLHEADEPMSDREEVEVLPQVYATKVWESGPSLPLTSLQDTKVFICDEQEDSSILAIHNQQQSMLYLFKLQYSKDNSSLSVTEMTAYSVRNVALVQCTRPKPLMDLLILQSNQLSVITRAGRIIPLSPSTPQLVVIKEVIADHWVKGVTTANQEVLIDIDRTAKDEDTRACWETLSLVLPTDIFHLLYSEFISRTVLQKIRSDSEFEVFTALLQSATQHSPRSQASRSHWEMLIAERRYDSAFSFLSTNKPTISHFDSDHFLGKIKTTHIQNMLLGLHLLHQNSRLSVNKQAFATRLQSLLFFLSQRLQFEDWIDYYIRLGCSCSEVPALSINFERLLPAPPDILSVLRCKLSPAQRSPPEFLALSQVSGSTCQASHFFGCVQPCLLSSSILKIYDAWSASDSSLSPQARARSVVEAIDQLKWANKDLQNLTFGVALPLYEALKSCTSNAPERWPASAFLLVDRPDLAAQAGMPPPERPRFWFRPFLDIPHLCKRDVADKKARRQRCSEQAHLSRSVPMFQDRRLEEVDRILKWTRHATLKYPGATEGSEVPNQDAQANFTLAVAARTVSLPAGDALANYMSKPAASNEIARAPEICWSINVNPFNFAIDVDLSSLPPDRKNWPEFHTGVVAALEREKPAGFDYTEISYNKPNELNSRHAGFLLGLGLTGRMRSMAVYQAFAYLDPKHEMTTIGVLLGLSAAFCGTADEKITSVLAVHLAALHPAHAADLHLPMITQAAAMLGVGLLHIGTKKLSIVDMLLKEFSNIRVQNMEQAEQHREAYALSLGFALGMNLLCDGSAKAGKGDGYLLARFRTFLDGDGQSPLPGTKKGTEAAVDVNVTAPSAIVALSLIYLGSGRTDVIALLEMPRFQARLDYIRPDSIMLRVIGRALIDFSSIHISQTWLQALVPAFLRSAKQDLDNGLPVNNDLESAYWSVIAGGCFAIGLKMAGTASALARELMLDIFDKLIKRLATKGRTLQQKLKRHIIQTCINVLSIALGLVFAGTGDLQIMKRLRVNHGKIGETFNYGTHLACHSAIGLLFLGKGRFTLGSSPAAIALLYCSFYPIFPSHAGDNRSHLQAARYIWTLAVEPRCLVVKEISSGKHVQLPVKVRIHQKGEEEAIGSTRVNAPTLVPEMKTISSVKVDSPRYYPATLNIDDLSHQSRFLSDRTLFVQRHAGHLDHYSDPGDILSIESIPGINAASAVVDFGNEATSQYAKVGEGQTVLHFSSDTRTNAIAQCLESSASTRQTQMTEQFHLEKYAEIVLLECLKEDKMSIMHLYYQIFEAVSAQTNPISLLQQQDLAFLEAFYASLTWIKLLFGKDEVTRMPLINRALIEHIQLLKASSFSQQIQSNKAALFSYFARKQVGIDMALTRLLMQLECPSAIVVDRLRQKALEALTSGSDQPREALLQAVQLVIQRVLVQIAVPLTTSSRELLSSLIVESVLPD